MTDAQILLAVGALAAISIGAVAFLLFGGQKPDRAKTLGRAAAPAARRTERSFLQALFMREPETAVDRLRAMDEERKKSEKISLRLRLTQAGLQIQPAQFLLIFYLIGAAAGGGVYVATAQPLAGVALAMVIGFLGPRVVLSTLITRRVRKFTEHFPTALDVVIRGVRSGLPVSESLKIVAMEVPEPVGPEIERLVVGSSLGQSMDEGLLQMSRRVPSPDVNFFRTVLSIQQKSGGNLAETLQNLSTILRERKKMKLKVRALSSEARMSAIIIGSLPFLVALLVYLLRPEYIMLLFNDERGHWMLGGGMIWMSFGVLMMRSMVRFEI